MSEPTPAKAPRPVADSIHSVERVTEVQHYTDRVFRFRTTRAATFRFRSGEFVMIGLPTPGGRPVMRAYSVASPAWDETLEFYSIKVPDGPLTSRLQHIQPGDEVLLARKATGTLVLDALTPGRRLFLFCTGTGFAPFASLLRDPETYAKFQDVVVVHTCRRVGELTYSRELVAALKDDPLVGEAAAGRVHLYDSCTREPWPRTGRITDLLPGGALYAELGIPPLEPGQDRAMICGSLAMNRDVAALMAAAGLKEGANAAPAEYVVEKAFVG